MNSRLKKAVYIILDTVIAVYMVLAVSSFDKPGVAATSCQKVNINIADEATSGFIDTREVQTRLKASRLYPLDKPMMCVSARSIESMLKQSPFVKTAQCYKTQDGEVYINITQRLPVVRIKANNGDDYYIDDKDSIMPNSHYTSDLIIATGSITRHFAISYITLLVKRIMESDLWKNQIEQINVLPDLGIEIIPRVGDHVVLLGYLPETRMRSARPKLVNDFVDRKLTRLEKFYRYGLSQAGWNKYSYIDLEFDNQIICRRR